jgi:hypothetical protein
MLCSLVDFSEEFAASIFKDVSPISKMEAACSSRFSVNNYQIIWRRILKDSNPHTLLCEPQILLTKMIHCTPPVPQHILVKWPSQVEICRVYWGERYLCFKLDPPCNCIKWKILKRITCYIYWNMKTVCVMVHKESFITFTWI